MSHQVPQTYVSIDNGYWSTKVFSLQYSKEHLFRFRSKIEKSNLSLIHNKNNTYKFSLDAEHYLVGSGANNFTIDINKTNNHLHKLLTYTALAILAPKGTRTDFHLTAMYPLNIYTKQNKKEFEKYLMTDYLSPTLNDTQKTFSVRNCLVFPQSVTAAYSNPELFKNKIVGILDVGGLTAQGCILKNFNLVKDSIFTEHLGGLILRNRIKKELNSKYNLNLQDYEMSQVIQQGIPPYPESAKLIQEIIHQHLTEIRRTMQLSNWNIKTLNIVLIGGGTLLIPFENFKQQFPNVTHSKDPVHDSVKGLAKVGELYYGKKAHPL